MNDIADLILGTFFILLGILVLWKSDKWVMMTVDMWPFGKLSGFNIPMMKLVWKLFGIFIIIFGLLAMLGMIK